MSKTLFALYLKDHFPIFSQLSVKEILKRKEIPQEYVYQYLADFFLKNVYNSDVSSLRYNKEIVQIINRFLSTYGSRISVLPVGSEYMKNNEEILRNYLTFAFPHYMIFESIELNLKRYFIYTNRSV